MLFGFEVFARSRPNLLPNPDIDPISALAFLVTNEKGKFEEDYLKRRGNVFAYSLCHKLWGSVRAYHR